jgi:LysM repeat protein
VLVVSACYGEQAVSSLRPLITISILGIICLVLYMKINETEPVVPADVAEWDLSGDLDIGEVAIGEAPVGDPAIGGDVSIGDPAGVGVGSVDIGATTNVAPPAQTTAAPPATTTAPAFGSAPSFGSAPTFDAAAENNAALETTAAPTTVTQPTVTQSALPAIVAPAQTEPQTTTPPVAEKKPAETKLPPLPALPAIAAGVAVAANEIADNATAKAETEIASATNSLRGSVTDAAGKVIPTTQTPAEIPNRYAALESDPVTPAETIQPQTQTTAGQASMFSAARLAVQSALDRGELSQALLLLSDWYGDPSLTAAEASEVQDLLSQLAGSVIYSQEHRLEPPYMVQAGEKLEDIATKYNIPWQLLAKINGIAAPDQLQPGQQLKVVRGPFSARIDLSDRTLVLMLNRRYAGQFAVQVDPTTTVEEGSWSVNQKLLTPGNVGALNSSATNPSEERSILLTNTGGVTNQLTILRAAGPASATATEPAGRVIQLKGSDVQDVYDILTLGSQVTIRR